MNIHLSRRTYIYRTMEKREKAWSGGNVLGTQQRTKKPYKTLEGEWRKDKRKNVTHFDLNGKIIGWFYIPICETVSIKNGKLTLEKVGGDDVWAQSKCESSLGWQKFENRKKGLSTIEKTNYVPEKYKNNKLGWFPISGGYGHCNEPLVEQLKPTPSSPVSNPH